MGEELLRSSVAEGLVGADGAVGPLPVEQFLVEQGDLERAGGDLIELLGMGTLGPLNGAVEFGGEGDIRVAPVLEHQIGQVVGGQGVIGLDLQGLLIRFLGFLPIASVFLIITFSEYPAGTLIDTQYAGLGVTFSGAWAGLPIIYGDGAMPDSPVLSPNPPFAGTFNIIFPSGATGVQLDSGYWDELETGVITLYNVSNGAIATLTNNTFGVWPSPAGVEHFDLSGFGTIGHITLNSLADLAGADIDNLQFHPVPEPSTLLILAMGLFGVAGWARKSLKLMK